MERYKSIFSEAKQVGILYHFTFPENANWVMHKGYLAIGIRRDEFTPGISTTRNGNIWKQYTTIAGPFGLIFRFTLNGDAISEKYKIVPISLFGARRQVKFRKSDELPKLDTTIRIQGDESEERILTERLPLKQYLISIDIIDKYFMELKGYILQRLNVPKDIQNTEELIENLKRIYPQYTFGIIR